MDTLKREEETSWDVDILRDLFNDRDQSLIHKIPLSIRSYLDQWQWRYESKGNYIVKSGYRLVSNTHSDRHSPIWQKLNLDLKGATKELPVESMLLLSPCQAGTTCQKYHPGQPLPMLPKGRGRCVACDGNVPLSPKSVEHLPCSRLEENILLLRRMVEFDDGGM